MAYYNYTDLSARVDAIVYSNESQAVTATKLKELLKDIIDNQVNLSYDEDRTYEISAVCVYDDGVAGPLLFVCIGQTTGTFVPADWQQTGV